MKHSLFLLCLAIALACGFHHTAAGLLTEPNPTPTELNSPSFVSDGAYQVAGIYHIVDYSKKMESYFGKRINDDEYNRDKGDCGTYGYVDSCSGHQIGSVVKHPVQGLTCYEKCVCDTSYYKYSSSNCASPKVLGGDTCADEESGKTLYSQCGCSADYNLSSCPAGAICSECGGKYKQTGCKSGYTASGNTCVKTENCSAYPLTVCPTGGICSKCPDNTAKLKLDSCDTSKGWSLSGNSCVATACPAGYTRGVTSCSSSSTKPDYSQNGWSGGQPCGMCKCNNIDSNCTAANYPLTSQSDTNANYSSCSTGCGSEKVTRYKITSCKSGYELKNGVCEASPTCPGTSFLLGTKSCTGNKMVMPVNVASDKKTICYDCVSCSYAYQHYDTEQDGLACTPETLRGADGKTISCYLCEDCTKYSGELWLDFTSWKASSSSIYHNEEDACGLTHSSHGEYSGTKASCGGREYIKCRCLDGRYYNSKDGLCHTPPYSGSSSSSCAKPFTSNGKGGCICSPSYFKYPRCPENRVCMHCTTNYGNGTYNQYYVQPGCNNGFLEYQDDACYCPAPNYKIVNGKCVRA